MQSLTQEGIISCNITYRDEQNEEQLWGKMLVVLLDCKAGHKPVVSFVTKCQGSGRSHLECCVHRVLEGQDKFQ